MLTEDFRTRLFHPEDIERLRQARKLAFSCPTPFENEQRALGKDGNYRWFLFRYKPLLDEAGRIDRWYMAATDIEDRKRAEEALQSNEHNLKLTINTIPTLAWSALPDGTVDFLSQRWLDYTGLSPDEALGWGWTAAIHPDDLNSLAAYWQSIMATGEPGEALARFRRSDGEYRWFLFRASAIRDQSGNVIKWYGTNTDIDDRKRAEANVEQAYLRLAEAQRLSKTGSFIADLVADEHDWSDETFRIFEFDPATRVRVQMIRDIIHPEDVLSFDATIARAMTGADVDFAFRILTSRGAMKYIRGLARIMAQNADRPLFIGALQDITESKVAEEALDKARAELAHVARITTLNALTASIAHEINQPLASLVTNASICLRRLNADPPNVDGARDRVQRTINDANRASDVIKRLRALFSKKEFTLDTIDLNEITAEVIALSLSDLQRNGVILRSELAEDLPPVIGDRVQLQQVTLNLLRNASDAMVGVDDRPRQLLVKTQREGGDRVRLSVQDSGCGVNPQDFERLFEAFYTTKNGGMGIGLSLSRSIIERHQGRLWAEPNEGPGTTFSFSIPGSPDS
jgi:PAS domain S-box-containing protein